MEISLKMDNWIVKKYVDSRIVLCRRKSKWKTVISGVPERSILGILLLFIVVNNIANSLKSKILIFANDILNC